jgi:hypothetical protein
MSIVDRTDRRVVDVPLRSASHGRSRILIANTSNNEVRNVTSSSFIFVEGEV